MSTTSLPIDEAAVEAARMLQAEMWRNGRQRPTYANSRMPEDQGRRQLAQELRRRLG